MPNKKTAVKREREADARRIAREIGATPDVIAAAQEAVAKTAAARTVAVALRAKDKLVELAGIVEGHVGQFQRAAIVGIPGTENYNPALWDKFKEWVKLYRDILDSAADFQDPRFKAIAVMASTSPELLASELAKVVEDPDKVRKLNQPGAATKVYMQVVKGKAA